MIITSSCIGMDSARKYTSVSKDALTYSKSITNVSVFDFKGEVSGAYQNASEKTDDKKGDVDKTKENKENSDTLSGNAESSLEYLKGKFNEITTTKAARTSKTEEDLKSSIRYMLLNLLFMLLIGKNGDNADSLMKQLGLCDATGADLFLGSSLEVTKVSESLSFESYRSESEETTFNASGKVLTSDGREIDFGIDISMSRSFEKFAKETGVYESLEMKLCDPLVLNFDTTEADIADQKFYFDLDCDGKKDEISRLGAGSGFLALDINGDGEINDGSELFGAKTGDGFKDLAKYDTDGNGWIDEADDVFDKLKVYCFDEDGKATLYSLKDKGVGAICLGNKSTEFSIKDCENKLNAQVRKTGIFLYETGAASTVQHVDLAIELGA